MKCKKCGEFNSSNSDYCPNCQMLEKVIPEDSNIEKINQTNNIEIDKKIENDKPEKKERPLIYISIFVISIFSGYVLFPSNTNQENPLLFLVSLLGINPISFFIAMVATIVGNIKCPKSKIIKVLFWFMILVIIIEILFIVWLIYNCGNASNGSFG